MEDDNDSTQPGFKRNRTEGYVVECNGMSAVISARAKRDGSVSEDYWSVGQLVSIHCGTTRIVGVLYQIDSMSREWSLTEENTLHIHVELVGEVLDDELGLPKFNAGLSAYPHIGAICHRIRYDDLAAIFHNDEGTVVSVGALSQNRDIPALISLDNMISRHFAVVGTTGVGKSTAVSLLIRKILDSRPDLRVLILDPHNEFEHALPDKSITIDELSLDLPFWLFTLEELAAAIFSGRTPVAEEMDILRDSVIAAKTIFRTGDSSPLARNRKTTQITADTPLPYRFSDLLKVLDERIGLLDSKNDRIYIRNLINRLQSVANDPRYTFMFNTKSVSDNIESVLSELFRVPANGKPVAILQLAGIPSEVVNSTVSVLCRLAFDLAVWSQSQIKTIVVCEEAHRYIPADANAGFQPTRAAIARVAKEGRKYGVSLAVITQRPSELDPTILSQCNTFFAMRLGNEVDQEIVRKAIPGGARSFVNFVPSLANREAIAFGQGASTPMRLIFDEVPRSYLPGNENLHKGADCRENATAGDLSAAIYAMRGGNTKSNTPSIEPTMGSLSEAVVQRVSSDPLPQQQYEAPQPTPSGMASSAPSGFASASPLRKKSVHDVLGNAADRSAKLEPAGQKPIFSGFGTRQQ